jgi:hypothetical protein
VGIEFIFLDNMNELIIFIENVGKHLFNTKGAKKEKNLLGPKYRELEEDSLNHQSQIIIRKRSNK